MEEEREERVREVERLEREEAERVRRAEGEDDEVRFAFLSFSFSLRDPFAC